MLKHSALVALVLLALLLLLCWLGGGRSTPPPAAVPEQALAAPTPPLPAAPLAADVERAPVPETPLPTAAPAEAAPVADLGALRGLILDETGAGLADAAVAVVQDPRDGAARQSRWTRSNADGYFEIAGIPAGRWSLRLTRRGPRLTQAEWCHGEVQIHAGQTAWTEVKLEGAHTLTGRFLLPGEDGLGLALVLRTMDPPIREIGECTVLMSAELDQLEADPESNPAEARSGEFWFWGLAPARYEILINLDVARQRWVRREADLRHGDGDLGTEVLRWEDFFAAPPASGATPR